MQTPYKKGRVYEDILAAQYGKRQPGSGNKPQAKEDVIGTGKYSEFLIQAKNNSGKTKFTVLLKDLQALRKNSSAIGKTGILIFNVGEGMEYAILRKEDLDGLVEASNDNVE
jgi:hypothetical protein